jgi:hypothetical protein
VKLNSSLYRVPRLRMGGALPVRPHIWLYGVDNEACTITGKTFWNSFFITCKEKHSRNTQTNWKQMK